MRTPSQAQKDYDAEIAAYLAAQEAERVERAQALDDTALQGEIDQGIRRQSRGMGDHKWLATCQAELARRQGGLRRRALTLVVDIHQVARELAGLAGCPATTAGYQAVLADNGLTSATWRAALNAWTEDGPSVVKVSA